MAGEAPWWCFPATERLLVWFKTPVAVADLRPLGGEFVFVDVAVEDCHRLSRSAGRAVTPLHLGEAGFKRESSSRMAGLNPLPFRPEAIQGLRWPAY